MKGIGAAQFVSCEYKPRAKIVHVGENSIAGRDEFNLPPGVTFLKP